MLHNTSIAEIIAMEDITLQDFNQSVAYKEIFGLGEQRGREQGLKRGLQKGLQEDVLDITLRLLRRRCGGQSPEQDTQVRALSLPKLEALAEALLDFQGPDDRKAWLTAG
jgi:predicted transposase YdaD